MPTKSQSKRYKEYQGRKGADALSFAEWNALDKRLAAARAARGTKSVTTVKTNATVEQDSVKRDPDSHRVMRRVDLREERNGVALLVDAPDLKATIKALTGYGAKHAQGAGYVSKRGPREKVYFNGNIENAKKALVSAGLQPMFG